MSDQQPPEHVQPAEYVQPPERVDGSIELAEHDPAWSAQCADEQERIRAALGSRALRLEHVGSTSVPGLSAKPVLDVVLVVTDPAQEAEYVPALQDLGYALHVREPGWYAHRLLTGRNPGVNLHVFPPACPEVERMVRFRDFLRAHAQERDTYERAKRRLAAARWDRVQDYAEAKSSVVADIQARAEED